MNQNMAAAMELRCWGGDWGLPSVHTESLIVLVTSASDCKRKYPGLLLGRIVSSSFFLRLLCVTLVSSHANLTSLAAVVLLAAHVQLYVQGTN